VTLFIVTFIIPEFVRIFTISGISLPVPTMILYNVGLGIKKFWYLGFLSLIGIIFAIRSYAKSDKGRLKFDRLRLDLPIIGPICRKSSISRFARTLGTLVTSGVPILESLGIVKEIVGNEVLARVIGNVRRSVEGGQSIAEPLKISQEFPMDIIQMISVGEESGSLDLMLEKISDFYNMSLGYTIKRLTTIIEPLFLAIMGLMVGFIMASILLPIFDMVRLLR